MATRRDPFETNRATGQQPDIYDTLRVAAPRSRSRQWEGKHQSHKAVYRGVDPLLALRVKTIAGDLLVPTGEVARFLLEYALQAYACGDLNLNPRPNPQRLRMTLFATAERVRTYEMPVRPKRAKQAAALWRVIVTWRCFSPELKNELSALASEDGLNVPVGELITALLRFALRAYEMGLLKLEPTPKAASLTLAGEGQ